MTGSHQDATGCGDQRKHVAGLHQVRRFGVWARRDPNGVGAIGRRNSGADAVCSLDRNREVGPVHRSIVGSHRRQLQLRRMLGRDRHADQAAPVFRKKVDLFRRDEIGRENQIALVLAILVVHQDNDMTATDLLDQLGGRRKAARRLRWSGNG